MPPSRNSKRKPSIKKSKRDEFPLIKWDDNTSPDIQLCILLYDERVGTYHRMKELDAQLDDRPGLAREIVELDSRNRLAHKELQLYNDHGIFVYKHPLAAHRKQYADQLSELSELRRTDPAALLTEITNLMQNIRRIRSNLSKKKYKSDDERESWEQNLARAELRKKILEEIIRQ